ncbi:MAG: hypothetical protein J6Q54_05025 [Oscillospiraceae bacterium]|nr:hypothetical protein [Oscillospiraceae bacterium]
MTPYTTQYTIIPELSSLSGLLSLAQDAAGQHCDLLGYPWEVLQERNLFWAVIRTSVKLNRLPRVGEVISVKTWPMPTAKTAYPRQVELFDETGACIAQVQSLWILMDTESRKMLLPGRSGVEVDGILLGAELETPKSLPPVKEGSQVLRTVTADKLDRNGHMNNARYMDWVQEILGERIPKSFTVNYLSEALCGDELILQFTETAETLALDILRDGHRIFAAKAQLTVQN